MMLDKGFGLDIRLLICLMPFSIARFPPVPAITNNSLLLPE